MKQVWNRLICLKANGIINKYMKKKQLSCKTYGLVNTLSHNRFFSIDTESIKNPQVIKVDKSKRVEVDDFKNNASFIYNNLKKISYSKICDIEALRRGVALTKKTNSFGVDALIKRDISNKCLKKLLKRFKSTKI